MLFFTWYLWPEAGRDHTFFTKDNFLLIFKYSSIYGIAAIGAAIVIISGGVDLSPGAVIALTTVVTGYCFVEAGWPLWASATVLATPRPSAPAGVARSVGCAFSHVEPPVVEYRVCPIAICPRRLARVGSSKTWATRPRSL